MVVSQLLNQVTDILSTLGSEVNHRYEAKVLVGGLLKMPLSQLVLGDRAIEEQTAQNVIKAAKRRAGNYPLQYLLGEWGFYGLSFVVGEGVLIPRSDTEVLCEVVISYIKGLNRDNPLQIADLCSGSGCIAVTIDHYCSGNTIYGIEKSKQAFGYLTKNVKLNNSNVICLNNDIFDTDIDVPPVDIIVSNPPYLTANDMNTLQAEVKFEPSMALYGEQDGLWFYKEIISCCTSKADRGVKLKRGGLVAFEIGIGQENAVTEILQMNNFKNIMTKKDLYGIIRVVYGEL